MHTQGGVVKERGEGWSNTAWHEQEHGHEQDHLYQWRPRHDKRGIRVKTQSEESENEKMSVLFWEERWSTKKIERERGEKRKRARAREGESESNASRAFLLLSS